MAFLSVPIMDTATRTNEMPLATTSSGPSWDVVPDAATAGAGRLRIVSNTIQTENGFVAGIQFINATYGPDVETAVEISANGGTSAYLDLGMRIRQTSSIFTIDGYTVRHLVNAGTDRISLRRIDNVVDTELTGWTVVDLTVGDMFGASITGNTLEAFYKLAAGAWTSLGTYVDTTYPAAGFFSMTMNSSSMSVINYYAGTVSGGSIFTPRATMMGIG